MDIIIAPTVIFPLSTKKVVIIKVRITTNSVVHIDITHERVEILLLLNSSSCAELLIIRCFLSIRFFTFILFIASNPEKISLISILYFSAASTLFVFALDSLSPITVGTKNGRKLTNITTIATIGLI